MKWLKNRYKVALLVTFCYVWACLEEEIVVVKTKFHYNCYHFIFLNYKLFYARNEKDNFPPKKDNFSPKKDHAGNEKDNFPPKKDHVGNTLLNGYKTLPHVGNT